MGLITAGLGALIGGPMGAVLGMGKKKRPGRPGPSQVAGGPEAGNGAGYNPSVSGGAPDALAGDVGDANRLPPGMVESPFESFSRSFGVPPDTKAMDPADSQAFLAPQERQSPGMAALMGGLGAFKFGRPIVGAYSAYKGAQHQNQQEDLNDRLNKSFHDTGDPMADYIIGGQRSGHGEVPSYLMGRQGARDTVTHGIRSVMAGMYAKNAAKAAKVPDPQNLSDEEKLNLAHSIQRQNGGSPSDNTALAKQITEGLMSPDPDIRAQANAMYMAYMKPKNSATIVMPGGFDGGD